MNRKVAAAAAVAVTLGSLLAGAASAQALQPFTPREESVDDLPAGRGREETFGFCAACHAYRLVANQGMTRERWDETLNWMQDRHSLPKLEGSDRDLILDYLAFAHPSRETRGGGTFRQPFAPP